MTPRKSERAESQAENRAGWSLHSSIRNKSIHSNIFINLSDPPARSKTLSVPSFETNPSILLSKDIAMKLTHGTKAQAYAQVWKIYKSWQITRYEGPIRRTHPEQNCIKDHYTQASIYRSRTKAFKTAPRTDHMFTREKYEHLLLLNNWKRSTDARAWGLIRPRSGKV